jgi:adenylate kinase family enzyme
VTDEPPVALIAFSGPVCAGKTTLAVGIAAACGATILTTRQLIARHLSRRPEEMRRSELQEAGDQLDRQLGGAWVANEIATLRGNSVGVIAVDSIRNVDQLAAVRNVAKTLHVHLTANNTTLATRYAERSRSSPQFEFPSFEELRANSTEAQTEDLANVADLILDTGMLDKAETLAALTRALQNDEP